MPPKVDLPRCHERKDARFREFFTPQKPKLHVGMIDMDRVSVGKI